MKKRIIIFISAAIVIGTSCKKGYFDLTENPNSATNTTPDLVLPQALTATASGQITGVVFVNEWMGYWCQSGSYAVSSSDNSSYVQTSQFGNGIWNGVYHNLEDYDYVEQASKSQNKYFYQAAAIVMKSYVFGEMVDMFNNIPYSQAFQGTNIIQPKYDNAQSIYESLVSRLDTAVTLMQRADAIGDGTSDVLFAGDNSHWIQFANTLKLRLLMRQTQMPGRAAYIQGEVAKIVANGGGFLTDDAAVNPGYTASSGKQNPFWGYNYNTAGTYINDRLRAGEYPIKFSIDNNDPRYKLWYWPAASPVDPSQPYVGNLLGSVTNAPGNASSAFGPAKAADVTGDGPLKSVDQSAILMSAAESYFLQAEANVRGLGIPDDAKTSFDNGVQASFSYLGAGDATAYYSQPGNKKTNYAAATSLTEKITAIIQQKYLAMNMVTPFEAWADYRRLHLPAEVPISVNPGIDVAAIPVRILYPTSEAETNAGNLEAQGAIDHHTSKIFWMP